MPSKANPPQNPNSKPSWPDRVRTAWARGQILQSVLGSRAAAFSGRAGKRLLLVTLPERIPQSQIYPFFALSDRLRQRFGLELREVSLEEFCSHPDQAPGNADVVCFQVWIDKTAAELRFITSELRRRNPRARIVFLDPFAPTDLRYASCLTPGIDTYVKKHVLRDRSQYGKPTFGDTNLSDWFGSRYGLKQAQVQFEIPAGFFDRMVIGPSFFTAPQMFSALQGHSHPLGKQGRIIDVHSRLGGVGNEGWYERMRTEAEQSIQALAPQVKVTPPQVVPKRRYWRELRDSKICFSPFGYGEVCWRDYEAVVSGALLVKPDMSHIETNPDIFEAGKTYASVRWDLADLGEVVQYYLRHPAERNNIAEQAFARLRSYAAEKRFEDHVGQLLGGV